MTSPLTASYLCQITTTKRSEPLATTTGCEAHDLVWALKHIAQEKRHPSLVDVGRASGAGHSALSHAPSASTLVSSNTAATVTLATASASLITAGTVIITAVLTTMLAATVTLIGWSFGWFNSETELSIPITENRAPLPQLTPGADVKARVAPFILVVKTDQEQFKNINNNEDVHSVPISPSGPNQFTLPLRMDYPYDFTINWGDGTNEVITTTLPLEFTKELDQEVTMVFASDYFTTEKSYLGTITKTPIMLTPTAIKSARSMFWKYSNGDVLKGTLRYILGKFSEILGLNWFYSQRDKAIVFTDSKGDENNLFPTHTYAKAGTYNIAITENVIGGFPAIYFNFNSDYHKVMAISQWGGNTWNSLNRAFYGCENLTLTATDAATALTGSVSDFSSAWTNCSGLTSFPLLNTTAGKDFSYAWFGCSSLTSFPLLNTAAGKDFSRAWDGCTDLTSFPLLNTTAGTDFTLAWNDCSDLTSFPLLNTAAGTNFVGAWNHCSRLKSFPLLNTAAGTNFAGAWTDCASLTSFPLLNTAAATNFYGAWHSCYSLTSFPLLNTAAGKDFSMAWHGCSGLTSFPLLNTAAGTEFYRAWDGCSGLTSFPLLNTAAGSNFENAWASCQKLTLFPPLNFGNMTNGKACFAGVTLDPDSYGDLLFNIAALNLRQKVTFDGGWSKANAKALAAKKILTTDRGWTIYDKDTPKLTEKNNRKKADEVAPRPKPQEVNDF
jgi:hypothetical protein